MLKTGEGKGGEASRVAMSTEIRYIQTHGSVYSKYVPGDDGLCGQACF
jgi:hypothetical protein